MNISVKKRRFAFMEQTVALFCFHQKTARLDLGNDWLITKLRALTSGMIGSSEKREHVNLATLTLHLI